MKLTRYKRELSTLLAYVALLLVVGVLAPAFFGGSNLRDENDCSLNCLFPKWIYSHERQRRTDRAK